MKKVSGIIVCILLVTVMIMSLGCGSKELSRSEAKKILDKEFGDGKYYDKFGTGFVFCKNFLSNKNGLEPDQYKFLENNGVIKIQGLGKTMFGNERYAVTIPEDIQKKYVASVKKGDKVEIDGKYYTKDISMVLFGTYSVNEITGIRQEGKDIGAKALVEFTVKLEPTPFGQILITKKILENKGKIPSTAKLERYDDGWRYIKNSLKMVNIEE